jgi:iron complex transport system substrate-binding protein
MKSGCVKRASLRGLWLVMVMLCPAISVAGPFTDAAGDTVEVKDSRRIVAIGSAVTETLFALGVGDRVIAVDSTSQWPEAVRALPQVGYQRTLGAEGILALAPTLVLGTNQAGPPATLDKLRAAGVPVLILPMGPRVEETLQSIKTIARLTGREREAAELVAGIQDRIRLQAGRREAAKPGVLFILSAAGGTPLAAGRGNNADSVIALAGGRNVVDSYEGYRPLSTEAVVGLAPDVIVIPDHVLKELGGMAGVLALPGIAATPAGRKRRVIAMDGAFLLGMGPRLPDAVEALARNPLMAQVPIDE